MITDLRGHDSNRRNLLLIGGVAAPCLLLLALGIWIIRQERELAEKRSAEDRGRIASLAGQELSARLETLVLRAVSGRLTPADGEIALVGSLEDGAIRLPWQPVAFSSAAEPELAEVQNLIHSDPANAITRLREAARQAGLASSRARATLLLMTALQKAGNNREASVAERNLRAQPLNVADEYGVPYFLYAAKRMASSSEAIPSLLRDLETALNKAWLPPAAVFMIADIARQTGSAGVALSERALARAKETERAISMLSESASLIASRISTESEPPLMSSISASASGAKRTVAVLRIRSVLGSIHLPSNARWEFGGGTQGLSINDTMPQLKIQFAQDPKVKSIPRQVLYGGALGLVFLTTALSGFLLHRDMRRDASLARLRSSFVSSVSHELRTPITTIRAYAEMLDMGRIQADRWPTCLKTIIGESERLSRLVEGVLEFSRLEQGKRTYRFQPVALDEVIASAAQGIRFALEQNRFELRIASDADLCITGDRHALEQVFINLLSNAIKYSGARREIDVGVRQDGRNAIVQVRDYGVGIAPEHQKRIFERFYRAEAPQAPKVPGVGLGLSIVEQIVTAHGGKVEVESVPQQGSTFSVILPLHT